MKLAEQMVRYWQRQLGQLANQSSAELLIDRDSLYRTAKEAIRQQLSTTQLTSFLLDLSLLFLQWGYSQQWLELCQQLNLSADLPPDQANLLALQKMEHLNTLKCYDEARQIGFALVRDGSLEEQTEAMSRLANIAIYTNQFEQIKEYGERALTLLTQPLQLSAEAHKRLNARTCNALCIYYNVKGESRIGIKYGLLAYELYKQVNMPHQQLSAALNLAQCHLALNEMELAQQLYHETQSLIETVAENDPKLFLSWCIGKTNLYSTLGHYQEVVDFLLHRPRRNFLLFNVDLAKLNINEGIALRFLSRHEEALFLFDQALELLDPSNKNDVYWWEYAYIQRLLTSFMHRGAPLAEDEQRFSERCQQFVQKNDNSWTRRECENLLQEFQLWVSNYN